MKRRILAVTVGLSLAIVGMTPGAGAQEHTENLTATDGDAAALGTGNATAAPGSVTRGGSPGTALLGPDGTYSVTEAAPPVINVSGDTEVLDPAYVPEPMYEPEPVYEPAPEAVAETTEPAIEDTAIATESDLDADNIADELEWNLGLDPNNADSDGDGVADGDEISIYLTDPLAWDTDGDGIGDGEELFSSQTDPLVWDTDGDGVADGQVTELSSTETIDAASGA